MIRASVFFLLLLVSVRAADLAAIDAYCRKALADWDVPGCAVAIVQDDKVVMAKGFGVRELGKADAVTENTLFAIASNTKAFTTAGIAILNHRGKLKWNDRVQTYLPWFQVFDDPWISHEARLDDLLCHRMGFRTFSGDLIWWNTPYSSEEVVRRARFLKPAIGFRRGFGYSNIMLIAAGEVIAHASGKTWAEFVREELLTPLQMTNTALAVSELKLRPDVATPHMADDDGKPHAIEWQPWDSTAAAGGIVSSAADLSQWLRLQLNEGTLNGRVFWSTNETWKMWSMHTPNAFSPDSFEKSPDFSLTGAGLGWMLADYRGEFIVRHGGAFDGMFSHTVMAPRKKVGIVVLSNGMTGLPNSIAYWALDEMLGKHERDWSAENLKKAGEAREDKKKAKVAGEEKRIKDTKPSLPLEAYAGRYGGGMYGDANVAVENGKLVLRMLPNPELAADLEHWQHDVFVIKWHKTFAWFGEGKLQFLLDQESKATEFRMDVPNNDFWFDELEFKRLSR